jgi:putative zinc finger/helix-turn-helix YgiT family protein
MKCLDCGTAMETRRENYRYTESGLKGVTLKDIEVSRCPNCGYSEVSIPHVEGLHRAIARLLIEKPTRSTGEEVRFLRKILGLSGVDLARSMGVAPETVSRWENDDPPIGPQADRLLRLMVAHGQPRMKYPTERLAEITKKTKTTRLELESREDEEWGLAVAAAH